MFALFFILASAAFASAGTSHAVNGYVDDCGSGIDVDGAAVVFTLADAAGNPYGGVNALEDVVGEGGKAEKSKWYAADVGNFDQQWKIGDIVLISISKDGFSSKSNVTLTGEGSDQAFSVCLGNDDIPEGGEFTFKCACGNGICETGPPLCENAEFYVDNVKTKRCPEDCSSCDCGNHICQWKDCQENMASCPQDCDPGSCGDNICQADMGEDQSWCPKDCGYYDDEMPDCGNDECEPAIGENWQTCPVDCYSLYAQCGDKVCNGAETQGNCCTDCGCPSGKCVENKCRRCCLFGYCSVWLGLCWYIWVLIVIFALLSVYAVRKKRRAINAKKKKLAQAAKMAAKPKK